MLSMIGNIVWVGETDYFYRDGAKIARRKYSIRGRDPIDGAITFAVNSAERIKEFDIKRGDLMTVTLKFDIYSYNDTMVNEITCVSVSHHRDIYYRPVNEIENNKQ